MKERIWLEIYPGYQKLILARIKESDKHYTRQEQRAELLWRNPSFAKELRQIDPENVMTELAYQKAIRAYDPHKAHELDYSEEVAALNNYFKFKRFCDRWRISRKWDGHRASLAEFVKTSPDLIYHPILVEKPRVDFEDTAPFPDDGQDPFYLLIRVDPWTNARDISSSWGRIEELKKAVFGFSDQDKWNFGEALCWYDLKMRYRYSYSRIAWLWQKNKAVHEDIDDIKTKARLGIKRISLYINRLTPRIELINALDQQK